MSKLDELIQPACCPDGVEYFTLGCQGRQKKRELVWLGGIVDNKISLAPDNAAHINWANNGICQQDIR